MQAYAFLVFNSKNICLMIQDPAKIKTSEQFEYFQNIPVWEEWV